MKREIPRLPEATHETSSLAGEHGLTDIGQIVLYLLFLGVWVADSFVFRYSLAGAAVPLFVRIPLCVAALAGSLALAVPAHKIIFGEAEHRRGVESGGVYARVRHPMYLGSWLFPVGLTVLTGSVASAAVCVVILLFYLYVSRHEEKLLLEKYADEYAQYMARVPMFVPFRTGRGRRRGRPGGSSAEQG
jgi:protein-S-isoprenylcysteine O-methyltransferase Ste14